MKDYCQSKSYFLLLLLCFLLILPPSQSFAGQHFSPALAGITKPGFIKLIEIQIPRLGAIVAESGEGIGCSQVGGVVVEGGGRPIFRNYFFTATALIRAVT